MQDTSFVPFTEEMKKDYTILVPNMLPTHFKLMINIFKTHGYNMELLETTGPQIAETGLKYVHNDTCYPAIVVTGQFMDALLSGKYDTHKTALIMFQTGGGCRASNYISIIRKALKKANMEYVPVISINFSGLEKNPGFSLTPEILHSLMYATFYGDLIMTLKNQVMPYEITKGDAESLGEKWTDILGKELGKSKKIKYKHVKENYKKIIDDFAAIPVVNDKKIKVGIVGEIFVKYSPLANNNLEKTLMREGAEVVVPGLVDFMLYIAYNGIMDYKLYDKNRMSSLVWYLAFKFLCMKKMDIIKLLQQSNRFEAWTPFERVTKLANGLISVAVKMGEGWLLTAEMMELADTGCSNIVCTQPFGCLPNHICGKGMMKPLKELKPDINIMAIDYDASASRVNQENRLKLMLANAKKAA